ncbi:hypothetical protein [Bacteroides sp.]|uniref:hypothetical protein n=1 Tax=Bacteroides sp. TaxID=29523 RepID=UPI002631DC9F|nr:hypothetical protein [Bacteroides sp.]MDD3039895.1 hypothetical protein [Bacteroides sp.]
MNELKSTEQSLETSKETYVKPAIEVIEMEVEDAVLQGYGGSGEYGGTFGDASPMNSTREFPWTDNSKMA